MLAAGHDPPSKSSTLNPQPLTLNHLCSLEYKTLTLNPKKDLFDTLEFMKRICVGELVFKSNYDRENELADIT
jgi:hypothetical protein